MQSEHHKASDEGKSAEQKEASQNIGQSPEKSSEITIQSHVDTLKAVVDGTHDDMDLTALIDMIDKAATALVDAGVGAVAQEERELDRP